MENAAADAVVVENPYGIEALWAEGGAVGRGTLIILLIMSAVSWYIIFTKLWDQRRLKAGAKVVEKQFWSSVPQGRRRAPQEGQRLPRRRRRRPARRRPP